MLTNDQITQILEWQQTCHEDDQYVQDGLVAHGPDLLQTAQQANLMWELLKKLSHSPVPGVRHQAQGVIRQVLAVPVPVNRKLRPLEDRRPPTTETQDALSYRGQ